MKQWTFQINGETYYVIPYKTEEELQAMRASCGMDDTVIPYGYCQCGCGEKTSITPVNNQNRGLIAGEPMRYIVGHHSKGETNPNYKGGKTTLKSGYKQVLLPNHPRAHSRGYVFEHVLIAEKALGKYLPEKAVVHHHSIKQIVICEDQAYHVLLHQRQRAYEACGHANWKRCRYCKEYSPPEDMCIYPDGRIAYHSECDREYQRNCRLSKKIAEEKENTRCHISKW